MSFTAIAITACILAALIFAAFLAFFVTRPRPLDEPDPLDDDEFTRSIHDFGASRRG